MLSKENQRRLDEYSSHMKLKTQKKRTVDTYLKDLEAIRWYREFDAKQRKPMDLVDALLMDVEFAEDNA